MIGALLFTVASLQVKNTSGPVSQSQAPIAGSAQTTGLTPDKAAALEAAIELPSDGLTPAEMKEEHWSDSVSNRDPNSPLYITPAHWKEILSDIKLGDEYAKEVMKEYKPSTNKADQEKVQKMGMYLAGIANTTHRIALWGDKRFSKFPYTFTVLKGSDVNAFSIFGGHVYVFEGLLKYAETNDEIAGTLAHEISHIAFRHLATLDQEQNRLNVLTLPLILIGILTGAGGGGAFMTGSLLNQAFGSGWSQKAETAADFGGLQILEHSKYPPDGILTLMEHLGRDERLGPTLKLGIFRTHPPSPQRAQALISEMKAAGIPVRRSISSTTFRTVVKPGETSSVDVSFQGNVLFEFRGDNAVNRAETASKFIDDFLDTMPDLTAVTAGSDHIIDGAGQPLFQVTQADLQSGQTLDSASQLAIKALQNAIYRYRYLVYLSDGPGPN